MYFRWQASSWGGPGPLGLVYSPPLLCSTSSSLCPNKFIFSYPGPLSLQKKGKHFKLCPYFRLFTPPAAHVAPLFKDFCTKFLFYVRRSKCVSPKTMILHVMPGHGQPGLGVTQDPGKQPGPEGACKSKLQGAGKPKGVQTAEPEVWAERRTRRQGGLGIQEMKLGVGDGGVGRLMNSLD